MTAFDFANAHPFLALLYLVLAGALLAACRPVSIRVKLTAESRIPAPDDDAETEDAEEETPEPDAAPPIVCDVDSDPAGETRTTASIRALLSLGHRHADVVPDLAEPIAETFREEDWTVTIVPTPPPPLSLGTPDPRMRLVFVWSPFGPGASS